jgi:hypothetical protein
MGQVTKLLAVTGAPPAPTISAVVRPQLHRDEAGVVQVKVTPNGGTFTMKVQGRLSSEGDGDATGCPWFDIDTIDNTDVQAATGTAAASIPIYPEMRFNLTAAGGGTTALDAWLME